MGLALSAPVVCGVAPASCEVRLVAGGVVGEGAELFMGAESGSFFWPPFLGTATCVCIKGGPNMGTKNGPVKGDPFV